MLPNYPPCARARLPGVLCELAGGYLLEGGLGLLGQALAHLRHLLSEPIEPLLDGLLRVLRLCVWGVGGGGHVTHRGRQRTRKLRSNSRDTYLCTRQKPASARPRRGTASSWLWIFGGEGRGQVKHLYARARARREKRRRVSTTPSGQFPYLPTQSQSVKSRYLTTCASRGAKRTETRSPSRQWCQ